MELSTDVVQVIHDYELPGKGFLPIKRNEILSVIERDPTGWWLGCNVRGRKGVFPSTYCVPYQMKVPLADTDKEFNLLQKAEAFNLNLLCPTISPINLEQEQINVPPTLRWNSEKVIADSLVELLHKKESLKSSIMLTASYLSASEGEKHAEGIDAVSTPNATASGNCGHDLASEMGSLCKAITSDKNEYLKKFQLPPLTWYKRLTRLLETSEEPLVMQLDDVREALKLKEAHICKALKRLTDEENSYMTKRDQITQRIHQRDALVIALLEDWASLAQRAKTKYTSSKEELMQASNMAERINECQKEVDLYDAQYSRHTEDLRLLEDSIKSIKAQLSRKQQLVDLDKQIKQINEQLAAT